MSEPTSAPGLASEPPPAGLNDALRQLAGQARGRFAHRFGRPPSWLAAAPGRVNLIGEHTDYNDGFVLPMAIERWTVLAAAPNGRQEITLQSSSLNGSTSIDLTKPIARARPPWSNYVRGVVAGFQAIGAPLQGCDLLVHSNVPLGGGLSSSAALEVATATLLEAVTGRTLERVDKALLCQRAEHEFAGVPCGIMDQFASTLARKDHLLLLDCRSRQTELVPWQERNLSILIINTNVRHELASGEYARRRDQCHTAARVLGLPALRDATLQDLAARQAQLDPVVYRRARHVITEIGRTTAAAEGIRNQDWAKLGELMSASHASLRDDYEVSCRELDLVVELAQAIGPSGGVIGCRMTGGGFGGCAVSVVRSERTAAISRQIADNYRRQTQIEPAMFVSRPADGARLLPLE
jgi:galactokinase